MIKDHKITEYMEFKQINRLHVRQAEILWDIGIDLKKEEKKRKFKQKSDVLKS